MRKLTRKEIDALRRFVWKRQPLEPAAERALSELAHRYLQLHEQPLRGWPNDSRSNLHLSQGEIGLLRHHYVNHLPIKARGNEEVLNRARWKLGVRFLMALDAATDDPAEGNGANA